MCRRRSSSTSGLGGVGGASSGAEPPPTEAQSVSGAVPAGVTGFGVGSVLEQAEIRRRGAAGLLPVGAETRREEQGRLRSPGRRRRSGGAGCRGRSRLERGGGGA